MEGIIKLSGTYYFVNAAENSATFNSVPDCTSAMSYSTSSTSYNQLMEKITTDTYLSKPAKGWYGVVLSTSLQNSKTINYFVSRPICVPSGSHSIVCKASQYVGSKSFGRYLKVGYVEGMPATADLCFDVYFDEAQNKVNSLSTGSAVNLNTSGLYTMTATYNFTLNSPKVIRCFAFPYAIGYGTNTYYSQVNVNKFYIT